jgi:hypothetical protein
VWLNGIDVVEDGGVYTARLEKDVCEAKPYFPGGEESDCIGGARHSFLRAKGRGARAGQVRSYNFDILVPTDFEYRPAKKRYELSEYFDDKRFLNNSRLHIAEWKKNAPKNHIINLQLDASLGVVFHDRICSPPEKFGEWISFEMLIKWAEDEYVRVSCDHEIVFEALMNTLINPFCYIQNHCVREAQQRHIAKPINFVIGLALYTDTYPGVPRISPEGIEIKIRNIAVQNQPDPISDEIKKAQQALMDAGFDPNGVDGKLGRGTRAALRAFQSANDLEETGQFDIKSFRLLGLDG